MTDFGVGQVLFTLTLGLYAIGRRDLPRVSKWVGKTMGHGVGTMIRMKTEFWSATKDSELRSLHREFQQGLDELQSIRSELAQTSSSVYQRPTSFSQQHTSVARDDLIIKKKTTATSAAPKLEKRYPSTTTKNPALDARFERLAMAEVEMQSKTEFEYSSKVEKQHSGADIVSECILQSTLLPKQKK